VRVALALLAGHAAAVVFGLAGMLVALRHPDLWAGTGVGEAVFSFGMRHGGALHIVLGAATLTAFGMAVVGARRTLVFFAAAAGVSLAAELIGTATGWPFGAYEYARTLGPMVAGRVPLTIPLSWFYLGFTSYLLARVTIARAGLPDAAPLSVALGVWFLVVWDLVLDPAMAHPAMPMRFWIWHDTGRYFGMPLSNFSGWALTAAVFMSLARWLWGSDVDARRVPIAFPLAVYVLNMLFAIVLTASIGLWGPALLALGAALLPTLAVGWRSRRGRLVLERSPAAAPPARP
jgi:putative membrane protein